MNFRGVSGARIDQITPQIAQAFAETDVSPNVSPYTLCPWKAGLTMSHKPSLSQMQSFVSNRLRRLKNVDENHPVDGAALQRGEREYAGGDGWVQRLD